MGIIISGDPVHKCEGSDEFHEYEVVEITDLETGVYILLQCWNCKEYYEGKLHKR